MIIDFRYHVASLVAVFLALGLGIIIGTAMLGNDVLIKSQQQMIDKLEKDTNAVRAENRELQVDMQALQGQLENEREFEAAVLPALVKNRLIGMTVAIVTTADVVDSAVIDAISLVLKEAGASVTSTTHVNQLPALVNGHRKDKVVSVLQISDARTEAEVVESLVQEVASDISMGTNVAIGSLRGMKLISTSGHYTKPVGSVVIVSGRNEPSKANSPKVDEVMTQCFKDMAVEVVGVETSDAVYSQSKVFKDMGASTVDNVQSVPGQLSLVLALHGIAGNFGTKETAKQLLPDVSIWR